MGRVNITMKGGIVRKLAKAVWSDEWPWREWSEDHKKVEWENEGCVVAGHVAEEQNVKKGSKCNWKSMHASVGKGEAGLSQPRRT